MAVPSCSSLISQFIIPNAVDTTSFDKLIEIDLSDLQAKTLIVNACQDYGFFKIINHGISSDLIAGLKAQVRKFITLPEYHKTISSHLYPYSYDNKRIEPLGQPSWIKYLLLNLNVNVSTPNHHSIFQEILETLQHVVDEYTSETEKLSCKLLELMAEGLGIKENTFSKLLRDERSDYVLRLNHYPPCEETDEKHLGFAEHTDPHMISLLRSNNVRGLEIFLRDDKSWVSIPPDSTCFFVAVGDTLQMMTNGRFESVWHRVVPDTRRSRLTMNYFAGVPLNEKISSLPCLLTNGEESSYNEVTWSDFKREANEHRLFAKRTTAFLKYYLEYLRMYGARYLDSEGRDLRKAIVLFAKSLCSLASLLKSDHVTSL